MRYFLLLLLSLSLTIAVKATHNRAGEITYKHLSGFTYEVTITTYTKTSVIADRPELYIFWGDGSKSDTLSRAEFDIIFYPDRDAQKNTYKGKHTFPGPGRFFISIEDPNRNNNIENLRPPGGQSDQVVFFVQSELIINPFAPVGTRVVNNSVQLLNPPLDRACIFQRYEHNPGAYDPDGDSLSYKLVTCRGEGGVELPYYMLPDQITPGPNNTITINPFTGDVTWQAPQKAGLYNIAILIEEWRNGQKVGSVMRDMQIEVLSCANKPPIIAEVPDTCIEAGSNLLLNISASDPNTFQKVKLSASGLPFLVTNSPAEFISNSNGNPISGLLTWNTTCLNVQKNSYQVFYRAEDDGLTASGGKEPSLVDLANSFIRIVAPAPKNLSSTPSGNSIIVNWDPSFCTNAKGYKLYRRAGSSNFIPEYCQTGLPASAGYNLIATLSGLSNTNYIDNDVSFSPEYCYRVLAYFEDDAESYVSEEVCSIAKRDIPVLTGVSVGATDLTTGRDTLQWATPTDIDTLNAFPGPYEYRVYREEGISIANTLISTTPSSATLFTTDTVKIDLGLNTQEKGYTYRVELYSNNIKVGSSSNGSSIFLKCTPGDRLLKLTWELSVPWGNKLYTIYKLNTLNGLYDSIGTSLTQSYTDSNLVNGQNYCYYVKSSGSYINPTIRKPLINYSQISCAIPIDKTPPCLPIFNVQGFCVEGRIFFNWLDTNTFCSADLKSYQIYFAPDSSSTPSLISSFPRGVSEGELKNQLSIAGCYSISVLDSNNNESVRSKAICIDNCPDYRLPDVFTPNGDGINDFFEPFPYRGIQAIDLKIYNRWGKLVFETTNPNIQWDGKSGGKPVVDGVYFYSVTIDKITLAGIVRETRSGNVTLFIENPTKNP